MKCLPRLGQSKPLQPAGLPARFLRHLKSNHEFVRPEFDRLVEENNQKILYMVPVAAQYIYLKVPVDGIEDFAGIPVRGADKNTGDVVSSLGMAGVAMSRGEFIPALAAGRVAEIIVAFLALFIPGAPSGIGIGQEYSAYLMGGAFLLGSGMTLRAGQQIRVELLLRAGNGCYARTMEILSALLGCVLTVFLAITLIQFTWRTFLCGEFSQYSFTRCAYRRWR